MTNDFTNNDLKHRDWLLRSQQKLIQSYNPAICTSIVSTSDGGKRLIIQNVKENEMSRLKFITNTDQNNNYLYLENFQVRIGNSINQLDIPGLKELVIQIYSGSDIKAFLLPTTSKTHTPFDPSNFNSPITTIGQFIDNITKTLPFLQNTTGLEKTYTLVLNPDYSDSYVGVLPGEEVVIEIPITTY